MIHQSTLFFSFLDRFHVKITTEQLFRFGAYLIPFICVVSVSFLSLIIFMVKLNDKEKNNIYIYKYLLYLVG